MADGKYFPQSGIDIASQTSGKWEPMNETQRNPTTRRDFLKTTGRLAAASALAGVALPQVHAAGSDLIQVALVGCGGRGTGAAGNALSAKGGPLKLVAMAD